MALFYGIQYRACTLLRIDPTVSPDYAEQSTGSELDAGQKLEGGWTALMLAALEGQTEAVRLLLEAGADVHAKSNDGTTALITAVSEGHPEIVELLRKAGARE